MKIRFLKLGFVLFIIMLSGSIPLKYQVGNPDESNEYSQNSTNTYSAEINKTNFNIDGLFQIQPDLILYGENSSDWFGKNVSDAGDFNGDGFSDVIVGAPEWNSGTGRAYIFFGGLNMNSIPDVTMTGSVWRFGERVSSAGDVNNDGYSDVLVSSPYRNTVYLYLGGLIANNEADLTLTGTDYFGWSISSAGDVNGDHFSDVIVGAHGFNNFAGRAYIYFGGDNMDNVPDIILEGANLINNRFGASVSDAGDVNNDGYSDVIVGEYGYSSFKGKAYIFFGGENMDNTADVTMTGAGNYHLFGVSVSSAGDFNNDGFSDVLIGESGDYSFNVNNGKAFIFLGGSAMDNSADLIFRGDGGNDDFGTVVSKAGDLNNDGFDDVLIARQTQGMYNMNGKVFIYYGGSVLNNTVDFTIEDADGTEIIPESASNAGDINNDDFDDIIVGDFTTDNQSGRAYIYFNAFNSCLISGPGNVIVNSVNLLYTSSLDEGFWTLSNYDNTEAQIVSINTNDTVLINSGSVRGQFVLYYQNSNGILCSKHVYVDTPYPVELASFTSSVSGRNVTLNWSTTSELNNSGFDIERSSTDNQWMNAGFINGNGTVSQPVSYSFTDKNLPSGKYKYRLKQKDYNGNFEYFELSEEVSIGIPDKYSLSQNYPNPFNPVTTINYDLPNDGIVTIKIYDILGREMKTLVNEMKLAGYHKIIFNAADLASGAYFYRMTAGDFVGVKKFVVMK